MTNRKTLISRALGVLLAFGFLGKVTSFVEANGGSILGNSAMIGLLSVLAMASVVCFLVGLVSPGRFSSWLGSRATRPFVLAASAATFVVSTTLNGAAMRGMAKQQQAALATQASVPQSLTPQVSVSQTSNSTAPSSGLPLRSGLSAARAGADTSTAARSGQSSLHRRVETLAKEQLGSRFRRVFVGVGTASKGKTTSRVTVEFKAGGVYVKQYVEGDMMNVYKALYTSGLPLSEVNLRAFEEDTDKFGKPRNVLVYHTKLTSQMAGKIGWENYKVVEWADIWTTVFNKFQVKENPPALAGADDMGDRRALSSASPGVSEGERERSKDELQEGDVARIEIDGKMTNVAQVDGKVYLMAGAQRVQSISGVQEETSFGGQFLIVRIAVYNGGQQKGKVSTRAMKLVDGQDREFDLSTKGVLSLALGGDKSASPFSSSINPGITKAFALVFYVPDDASDFKLRIPASFFGGGKEALLPVSPING